MIERRLLPILLQRLDEVPAVVLLGPRQAGKTTLALALGKPRGALYLDLESEQDRAKLAEPELYLSDHLGKLVILETLLSHPVVGASWEGFVIENLLAVVPEGVQGHFYRTSGGADIDLVLSFPDGRLWAVEIKRSLSPRPERGFHPACADIGPVRRFVVYPGDDTYSAGGDTQVVSLPALARLLAGAKQ
jgi:predicted AAA+ superfamily ATPase